MADNNQQPEQQIPTLNYGCPTFYAEGVSVGADPNKIIIVFRAGADGGAVNTAVVFLNPKGAAKIANAITAAAQTWERMFGSGIIMPNTTKGVA